MRRPRTRRRVAFYSHDTQGLGHICRNIELAAAIVGDDPATDVLLITGAAEAASLPLPAHTELVVLPSVSKDRAGDYAASTLRMPLDTVLSLRGDIIAAAVQAFSPDLLVVDKEARGLQGELETTLSLAPSVIGPQGQRMRVVLGLREVLDSPETTRRQWREAGTSRTVLEHYDQVWVYGDPSVRDLVEDAALPAAVRDLVRFTGYLAHGRGGGVRSRGGSERPEPVPTGSYVLCLVGGGQDGAELARAFADAVLPDGHQGVLVTGPYMGTDLRAELERTAAARDDLVVHEFLSSTLSLTASASAVVSMGGYNSVCEVLAAGCPALVVPRETPRLEQAVRADALAARTHLEVLRPQAATAPALSDWMSRAVATTALPHQVDLDGLARIPGLARDLLAVPAPSLPPLREVLDAIA